MEYQGIKFVYLIEEVWQDYSSNITEVDICYHSIRIKALKIISKNNRHIDEMNTVVYQAILENDKSFDYEDLDPHFYESEKDTWVSNYNKIIIHKKKI